MNAKLCLTHWSPMDYSLPGSSVHGILQGLILEWVTMSSSKGSPQLRDQAVFLMTPALVGWFFTTSTTWKAPFITYFALYSIYIYIYGQKGLRQVHTRGWLWKSFFFSLQFWFSMFFAWSCWPSCLNWAWSSTDKDVEYLECIDNNDTILRHLEETFSLFIVLKDYKCHRKIIFVAFFITSKRFERQNLHTWTPGTVPAGLILDIWMN